MRLNLFRTPQNSHRLLSRILGTLGPTWRASPIRRLVQSLCLIGFLILFFYVCWPYGSKQYAEAFRAKEIVDAELFLILDPLVSLSTAIAGRMLVWSLAAGAGMLLICMLFPRAFCGYVCPLGTLFDGFDWLVGRWAEPFTLKKRKGWWAGTRYYLLAAVVLAAMFGVLLSGFVAAIPVLTRAMLFLLSPVQTGLLKGWYLVPTMNAGHVLSILLVAAMVSLSLLGRRFWCSYVCPTGALFSTVSVFRLAGRRVTDACVKCGRCLKACSFAAINEDFSTRALNCTFCQTCGGSCPAGAIEFTTRWTRGDLPEAKRIPGEASLSRRGLLVGLGSSGVMGVGVFLAAAKVLETDSSEPLIRPPGSVPEARFLQLCIRCGQCIKVCPNNVLQAVGFEQGFNALWTPKVAADWSGCDPSCNNCGQVCPTGAVRALPLEEKVAARIGLAEVDRGTCLPHAGKGPCQLCVDECRTAGYDAIEFIRVGGEVDEKGEPVEGSGYLAPVVREDRCVGCGLCQMRCRGINVKSEKRLHRSAIRVVAGPGREDRIVRGSYVALREGRAMQRHEQQGRIGDEAGGGYLPDFLK